MFISLTEIQLFYTFIVATTSSVMLKKSLRNRGDGYRGRHWWEVWWFQRVHIEVIACSQRYVLEVTDGPVNV